jgi:hypothetical protein
VSAGGMIMAGKGKTIIHSNLYVLAKKKVAQCIRMNNCVDAGPLNVTNVTMKSMDDVEFLIPKCKKLSFCP